MMYIDQLCCSGDPATDHLSQLQ